jgi:site-specific recombinase XerD
MYAYHFDGKRLKFSTGEAILPADWNPKTHRPRRTAPLYGHLMKLLDRIEARTKEVHLNLKSEFIEITPDKLRLAIIRDIRLEGGKESLLMFWDRYTEGKDRGYKAALAILKSYKRSKDFADITPAWLEAFCQFMAPKYSLNYQGKVVMLLRDVMGAAYREGLHRNDTYKDFSPPKEEVDTIYLSVDELLAMHRLNLSGTMAHIRDRFLIGAFTGLRFSDSQKVTLESVRSGLLFDKNKKTKTNVVIPVHWVVNEIMAKYPDGLPPVVTGEYSNRQIKVIGERAGIKTMITNKGHLVPKYTLISTHTARRSFATNAFLAGIPAMSITFITGHKTEAAFKKYIRITTEQNARSIAGHAFFNKPVQKVKL